MMVVDNDSSYNAILGRPWIRQMDAVTSSLHQMLKFLKKDVEIVKWETAWMFYVDTMKDTPEY